MATTIKYQGTEIKLTSKYQGVARPWGEKWEKNHYRVFVTINGTKVQFEYYCNDVNPLKADALINAFYCFLSDGIAYRNAKDKYDFADEFGYDKYEDRKRLNEVWQGCMSAYDKWSQFGIDIYEITNWLQETYDL